MKIIALLPFENDSWILPTYLSSINPIVDEVIGMDNGSIDNSGKIIEKAGGKVYLYKKSVRAGWPEYKIRKKLLELGREHNGTHFVLLDTDEAFTYPLRKNFREILRKMKPGQKMYTQWLALWKSPYAFRNDRSVWSNNFKDFIFCDDKKSQYKYEFLGVQRTPGVSNPLNLIRLPLKQGAVAHFQFLYWNDFQIKQAWYRCYELIKKPNKINQINYLYSITLDTQTTLKVFPNSWLKELSLPKKSNIIGTNRRITEIYNWFDEYGIDFFEKLQIWHIPILKEKYLEETEHYPKCFSLSYYLYMNFKKTNSYLTHVIKKIQ